MSPRRVATILVLFGSAALGLAAGAAAQSSDGEARYGATCRPPLKFMAGACVPQCYAGYEDRGRWCEERRMGGGGGGP